jgi:hypothetical protein
LAPVLGSAVAGERDCRGRQDFPLGCKPMLVGFAVDAAMCGPNFVSALANAVFQSLIHVRNPAEDTEPFVAKDS